MNKNELWQKILHIAITILTAIATTFGVTSCMGYRNEKRMHDPLAECILYLYSAIRLILLHRIPW